MIRKYLADCWSTLIVYLFCVAVFALFCVLYDLKFSLIGDFVRFTWLVAVGAAFFKTVRTFRILRRVESGNIDESFGRTLVEREFLRKMSEEKDNLNQRAQKLEQEFKERYDYLIVWSHEMKTPLTGRVLFSPVLTSFRRISWIRSRPSIASTTEFHAKTIFSSARALF